MKTVFLFLVLGIHAMSSVAQIASASFQNTAGSSILGNGTAKLEDRIAGAAAAHVPFESFNVPSAPLPQLAVNLPLADDSDLPFGTSQRVHYGFFR